jgi:Fur family ferric uptake transcriptional regulator
VPHLKEKLRHAGLKATRGRLEVMRALAEMGGHRSADEIHQALLSRGKPTPRGSVFKVVGDLCRAGLLMVTEAGRGHALYELAESWHHHFVCRLCGAVHDVPCMQGRKPCMLPDGPIPGRIDEAQIIFRGVCHSCAGRSTGST